MTTWTLAGATVVDGTGAEPRIANVVIENGRIATVDRTKRHGTVIDATGLVATPGFVDIHSHVDWIVPLEDGPPSSRRTSCKESQRRLGATAGSRRRRSGTCSGVGR